MKSHGVVTAILMVVLIIGLAGMALFFMNRSVRTDVEEDETRIEIDDKNEKTDDVNDSEDVFDISINRECNIFDMDPEDDEAKVIGTANMKIEGKVNMTHKRFEGTVKVDGDESVYIEAVGKDAGDVEKNDDGTYKIFCSEPQKSDKLQDKKGRKFNDLMTCSYFIYLNMDKNNAKIEFEKWYMYTDEEKEKMNETTEDEDVDLSNEFVWICGKYEEGEEVDETDKDSEVKYEDVEINFSDDVFIYDENPNIKNHPDIVGRTRAVIRGKGNIADGTFEGRIKIDRYELSEGVCEGCFGVDDEGMYEIVWDGEVKNSKKQYDIDDETFHRTCTVKLSSDFSVIKIYIIDWNVLSDEEAEKITIEDEYLIENEKIYDKWTWMGNE